MSGAAEYFSIDVHRTVPDRLIVHLQGEFDLSGSETLRETLFALVDGGRPAAIVVDLARVAFIDSEAIGAILDGYSAANAVGIEFRLRSAYSIVRRVFDVLGLLALFEETASSTMPASNNLPEPSELWRQDVVRNLRQRDDTTS